MTQTETEVYCRVLKINDVMNDRVVSRQSPLYICLFTGKSLFSFHAFHKDVSLFPRSSIPLSFSDWPGGANTGAAPTSQAAPPL